MLVAQWLDFRTFELKVKGSIQDAADFLRNLLNNSYCSRCTKYLSIVGEHDHDYL